MVCSEKKSASWRRRGKQSRVNNSYHVATTAKAIENPFEDVGVAIEENGSRLIDDGVAEARVFFKHVAQ